TPSMTIALQVSYKGTTHSLVVDALDTVASLKERIAELTAVPVGYQKLMHKAFHIASEASLLSSLFAQGTHKILLVGSTASDVAIIQNKDAFMTRRRGNFSQAGSKITEKAALRQFTFGAIKPLEGLPNSDPARRLLIRIREDVGIIEVMRKHHWYVHTLTEMPPVAPTEEGKLLGFNKNAGEEISLRLRTDDMSGFRHYRTIISTVLHELVHMEIGPHNDDFHALNRILNKEYDSFSTGRTTGVEGRVDGSQYFTVEGEAIRDSSASYQGGAFVLGGTGSSS
ncbi:WLM domain-containing protein, partial [Chytriomyces sp. MP71]